jgi:hypothetical protein
MAKTTRTSAPAAKKKSPKPVAKSAVRPKAQAKPKAQPAPAKAKPKSKPPAKSLSKPSSTSNKAKPAPARKPAPPVKAKPSPKPIVKSSKIPAPKPVPAKAKPAPAAKPSASAPVAAVKRPAGLKGKDAVRAKILAQRAKPAKPSSFSLDEVLALARTAAKTAETTHVPSGPVIATKSGKVAPLPPDALKPVVPTKVKAASLADILGFNPKSRTSHAENEEAAVPEKFKRYYKLLIELRNHVTGQVDQHSEETLKRSAKEDSGDLSSYGTDGGTDSFDRDFALSLVANEQEALSEIESAIQRI